MGNLFCYYMLLFKMAVVAVDDVVVVVPLQSIKTRIKICTDRRWTSIC